MISINKINIQYVKHHFLPILTELNLKIFLIALGAFSILATSFYLCYVHYLKAKKIIPQSTNGQITKPLLNQIPTFLGTPIAEDLDQQLIQGKESQGLIFNKNLPQAIEILIYSFLSPQSVCRFAWVNQSSHNLSKQPQIIALQLNNISHMIGTIVEKFMNEESLREKTVTEILTKFIKLVTNQKIGYLLKKISHSPGGMSMSVKNLMLILKNCQNLQEINLGHDPSILNSKYFDQLKNQLNEMKKLKKLTLRVGGTTMINDKVLDLIPIGIESLRIIGGEVNRSRLSTTFQRLTNLKELNIFLKGYEHHKYFAHLSRLESLNCQIEVWSNKSLIEIFDGLKNLKKFTGAWNLYEDLESETLQHFPECMETLYLRGRTGNISNEDFKQLFKRLKKLKKVVFDCSEFQHIILSYLPNSLEELNLDNLKSFDFTFLEIQRFVNLKTLCLNKNRDIDPNQSLYGDISNSFFSQLPKSLLKIDFFKTNIAEKDYVKNYIQIRRQCPNAKIKLPREENQPDLAELEARRESIFEISDKQVV